MRLARNQFPEAVQVSMFVLVARINTGGTSTQRRGAPPEGLDLVVLAIESSRGLPAIDDGSSSPLPESPRKKRKEPEQASSLPAAADVTSSVETLRERSPSDDQKPPGEEASVITPPPQAAKTAWPEESKAAVQKTLNPSPDNSVDGAGQPVSPV